MRSDREKNDNRTRRQARLVTGLLRGIARLPLGMLYGFSDFAGFILRDVVHYRHKVIRKNLTRVFGDDPTVDIREIERAFYRNFCDVVIEAIKLLHISDKEMDRRVEVVNAHLVDEATAEGRPSVIFLGHYGNWEWVTAIVRHFKRKVDFSQIYSPLRNKVADEVMLTIRSRFGSESIPKERTVRRLYEIERSGGTFVTGFIADQRPLGTNLHHWMDFLGQDTAYMVGGEDIGKHFNARFFFISIEKPRRGHYRLEFMPVKPIEDGDPNPVTRGFMKMLERQIRKCPELWLWSHNRWMRTREECNLGPTNGK